MDDSTYENASRKMEYACDVYLETSANLPKRATLDERMLLHKNFVYQRDKSFQELGITVEDFLSELNRRLREKTENETNTATGRI